MLAKSALLHVSHCKAPKTQQVASYKHTRKTSELFLWYQTGVKFSSNNNLANLGSLAKVSVPVRIIPEYVSPFLSLKTSAAS